jgi:ankyrin repeat protein
MKRNSGKNIIGLIALAILAGCIIIAYLGYSSRRGQGKCLEALINTGNITEIASMLNKDSQAVNTKCKHGRTPLHFAAFFSKSDIVKLFIEKGADVNARDNSNFTPLFYARDAGIAELLIKSGAEVNASDGTGYTPLHHAVRKGDKAVIKMLIENGADANIEDSTGATAIGLTEFSGRTDIADVIHEERQKRPNDKEIKPELLQRTLP